MFQSSSNFIGYWQKPPIYPLIMFHHTILGRGEKKAQHWFPAKDEIIRQYRSHEDIVECIREADVVEGKKVMERHIREAMPIFETL